MDELSPHETELVGRWIESDGKVRGDAVCGRIERLTGGILDVVQDHPEASGWRRLFRDIADGRYWERYYPQSEMHGGGPPALRLIADHEVTTEYHFTV
ncbi:Imm27 family immunity protein [Sphingomonas sp.]|uniref:Imm27 family immunity protein n=1 Tax=Sphingomonas sp. TaxID=28214 RepID=UPI000DB7F720|nr:Imm27 family immunity protein [Sphingomonas sp.]PZU11806.1 MAG: hypothetical protein DI605_02245 [Sphingomonas sp.]